MMFYQRTAVIWRKIDGELSLRFSKCLTAFHRTGRRTDQGRGSVRIFPIDEILKNGGVWDLGLFAVSAMCSYQSESAETGEALEDRFVLPI
jgi:hypothetical protein